MKEAQLGYHIRKMMNIERKLGNKNLVLASKEWLLHQQKAATLLTSVNGSEDQKRLIFRHTA
jgi:hypothetical protein